MFAAFMISLEFVAVALFFRFGLGYSFRKNRVLLAIGMIIILIYFVGHVFYSEALTRYSYWGLYLSLSLAPVFFFQGKTWILGGIGLFAQNFLDAMSCVNLHLSVLISRGNLEKLNDNVLGVVQHLMLLGILAGIAYGCRNYQRKIHASVEHINPFFILLLLGVQFANKYYLSYTGTNEMKAIVYDSINILKNYVLDLVVLTMVLLAVILVSQQRELKRLNRLNEKCIAEQTEQYLLLDTKTQDLRQFRHDHNAHLRIIRDLAKAEHYDELVSYIDALEDVGTELSLIRTGNLICDAVLNRYLELCRKEKIQLEILGKVEGAEKILETDLCVLLSNGLQNAYEAAVNCSRIRKIEVEFMSHEQYLMIMIRNTAAKQLVLEHGLPVTGKEDKINHGLGTRNMMETARKYSGTVTWECDEEGIVHTTITLF